MCEYCDLKKPIYKDYIATIIIQHLEKSNFLGVEINRLGGVDVQINYCPVCGKKLKEEL